MAEPREGLTIIARRFVDRGTMVAARERLWAYMTGRLHDPRRVDPPPLTIGAGLDADSAAAFLVVVTDDEHAPEVELMAVMLLAGAPLPLDEVPDDYLDGLIVRRAQMAREGELTRFDSVRPQTLKADGSLEDF